MKRHIGKMANTDQRLVVAFMQIPNREDHALVIPTDTLPARFEQAVMEILESPEGQNAETLAEVLNRRLMPDTGKPVLQTLHEHGMLKPVPVANILMLPAPNMPFPLTQILQGMGRVVPDSKTTTPNYAVEKYNQIAVNQKIEGVEQRRAIAQNLIIEAEMLENEAKKKRQRAYETAPEIAPKTNTTPAVTIPNLQDYATDGSSLKSKQVTNKVRRPRGKKAAA